MLAQRPLAAVLPPTLATVTVMPVRSSVVLDTVSTMGLALVAPVMVSPRPSFGSSGAP